MSTGGRQFFFVNKDADSKALSNSHDNLRDRRALNRFVQHSKYSELERRKNVISTASGLVGWHKRRPLAEIDNTPGISQRGNGLKLERENSVDSLNDETEAAPLVLVKIPDKGIGDPFSSVATSIDGPVANLIQYYTTAWMPGKTKKGHLSTFTPLLEDDLSLGSAVVQRSLLHARKVHIHALMAATAGRMKQIHGLVPAPNLRSEMLTAQALRSLRLELNRDGPLDPELLLVIFFLAVAEWYNQSVEGTQIHWRVIKRFVIHLGGFLNVEPLIATLCVGADFLSSATNLVAPVFDFIRQPELLGLLPQHDLTSLGGEEAALEVLSQLQPRVKVLLQNNVSLVETLAALNSSPAHDFTVALAQVQVNEAKMYRLITTSLQCVSEMPISQAENAQVVLADTYYNRARALAILVWILIVSETKQDHATDDSTSPQMFRLSGELSKNLWTAESMLHGTSWGLQPNLHVWLSLVQQNASKIVSDAYDPTVMLDSPRTLPSSADTNYGELDILLAEWPPLPRHWIQSIDVAELPVRLHDLRQPSDGPG